MAWNIELSKVAERELDKLDPQNAKRILSFLYGRLRPLNDPRSLGAALTGQRLGEFWRYRVGDYRIIAKIEDNCLRIMVVKVGNRCEVYR